MVIVPGLLLVGATALFRISGADVAICRLFYAGEVAGWPGLHAHPWDWLYHYGPCPGLVLGIGGAAVAVASSFWATVRPWQRAGLFLALLLALGPGLMVNGVFKPRWGRPRPLQIKEFGGSQDFVSVWSLRPGGIHKSFPCGHASMGFYLMGPAFLCYRRHPKWAVLFLGLGLAGGTLLGLGRVAQGRHFPSDVLWSGGMVYSCGLSLAYVFHAMWRETGGPTPAAEEREPVILSIERARGEATRADEGRRRRRAA